MIFNIMILECMVYDKFISKLVIIVDLEKHLIVNLSIPCSSKKILHL